MNEDETLPIYTATPLELFNTVHTATPEQLNQWLTQIDKQYETTQDTAEQEFLEDLRNLLQGRLKALPTTGEEQ